MVDPAALTAHPLSLELFGDADGPTQAELERDVAEHGVDKPLHVSGDSCASPPGTVYSGNRRRAAALKAGLKVPAIRLDGLSADDEAVAVIRGNLSDLHARKLSEEQKFRAEKRLREILGRSQGQRTDLDAKKTSDRSAAATWTGPRPSPGRAPKTSQTVAKKMGQTRNAVEDRKKIFESAVSTNELREAVNTMRISRSAAGTLVRAIELEYGSRVNEPAVQQAARDKLNAGLLALVHKKKNGPGPKKAAARATPTRARGKQLVEQLEGAARALVKFVKVFGGEPKRVKQVAKLLSPAISGEVGRQIEQLVDGAPSARADTRRSGKRTARGRS